MSDAPLIVSLPIADRPTLFEFYQDGLGLETHRRARGRRYPRTVAVHPQRRCSPHARPGRRIGWVIGDREVAPAGSAECLLSILASTDAEVDELVVRATRAGATVVVAPGRQPWGYVGTFADPDGHLWMVTAAPGST